MTKPLHSSLFLAGPAGRLEALLWDVPRAVGSAAPPLAAVVCHPHPLFGGTMHNKVVYQVAKTLHRFGVPVLRFNFRGAGASAGKHDGGRGEQGDVTAALDFLAAEFPATPLLVAGFSFGSWVGLRVGCADARVSELIGLGLPVGDIDNREFAYLAECAKPKLILQGGKDQFGPPSKLETLLSNFPAEVKEQTRVEIVPGADHFFVGRLDEVDQAIAKWIVARHPGLRATSYE